jgi:propionyl-CoA synthetase
MCSNMMGLEPYPVKMGSPTFPVPGYNVQILDDKGNSCQPGETGNIVVKLPLPPSCLPTLWNDNQRFRDSYLSKYPGYYLTGDGGLIDEDGYVYVMGRVDDVINVAGHRLSTGQMEELIASHPAVAECAVVGIDDELRGQVPVGFAVLKDGTKISQDQLEQEMVGIIRKEIGAVAYFKQSVIVSRLPKTRSGKILRKTIRQLAKGENVPAPPTIDDPAILGEICQVLESCGIGSFASKS